MCACVEGTQLCQVIMAIVDSFFSVSLSKKIKIIYIIYIFFFSCNLRTLFLLFFVLDAGDSQLLLAAGYDILKKKESSPSHFSTE